MVRRPLSALLSSRPSLTRGRELARAAVDSTTDVLHPLFVIARGLRRQAGWARDWWGSTPKDRRGPALLASVGAGFLVLVLLPYGAYLMFAAWMGSAGWMGRDRTPAPSGPSGAENDRLTALYEALVPYLSVADDPSPLYAHDGSWENVFGDHAFEDGRLVRLHLKYPAYFTDGEAAARARVEHVLHAKVGRGREYRFEWNEEENHLTLTALPPLPTDIAAQRFVTSPGETVLGFTDPGSVQRTVPVQDGEEVRDAPPVVWRTGPRSTEPHLLALGHPGTGTTTLLRSIALQALPEGDVVVVDGSGTGEYAFLSGRPGVMAVESGLAGTLATLEWAAHETERRLIAVNRARQAGRTAPDDVRRPLWILVDRPTVLSQLAHAESRPDPQELLDIPLRHGRAAGVTVAVADHLDGAEALSQVVVAQTRARVLLGAVTAEQTQAVLGAPQCSTSAAQVPPGRGYVRLGTGPVLRVQVPATPDPFDEDAGDAHRQAVMALLPPADGAHGTEPREREAATADAPGAVMVSEPSGAVRQAGDPALER
ncbi:MULTISPECIES: ATP-binding protein [unclassified Streptomyces]|uniref:ATP-binding protein n=1 Tax=unclassified Streptomyces TaxID=2593676 RepID=UPI00037B2932|nr:ATP-binding protein [Streptomyces sp. BoleA5]MYX37833.1 hypothetical protein [Streptomyces sp. SID8377]